MLELVAHLHLAATLFMVGVIWYVQVVHYPLFQHVNPERYRRFQKAHESRTGWVVAPAMTVEVLAAGALAWLGWTRVPQSILVAGLLLLALIWTSTVILQVPMHRTLESGYDRASHRFLTASNWVRTTAWTARAVLAYAALLEVVRP